jgi:hypothetical protein
VKKIDGRKRHSAVDVMGLILCVMVTAASVQDRDGARRLLWQVPCGYSRTQDGNPAPRSSISTTTRTALSCRR